MGHDIGRASRVRPYRSGHFSDFRASAARKGPAIADRLRRRSTRLISIDRPAHFISKNRPFHANKSLRRPYRQTGVSRVFVDGARWKNHAPHIKSAPGRFRVKCKCREKTAGRKKSVIGMRLPLGFSRVSRLKVLPVNAGGCVSGKRNASIDTKKKQLDFSAARGIK